MYGMHFFDEDEGYFGNTSKPVIGAGNGFWTQRSVKIVADGTQGHYVALKLVGTDLNCRFSTKPELMRELSPLSDPSS